MDKRKPNPKANRNILYVASVFAMAFVGMMVYFAWFLQAESKSLINNPYNSRLDQFASQTVRGEIVSRDGQALAKTEVASDGTETRVYPFGSLFVHVVGHSDYGKTGLESLANFYLLSSHANIAEKVMNQLSGRKNEGDRVVTTLDVTLQKTAEEALGGRNGAVIAMEPGTGKVLAMVSKPDYDPNTLSDNWESLISGDNTEAQLLNRATQGVYPPGSVFKIVTLLEYIREHPDDWRDYSFDCSGTYQSKGSTISCYHKTAHGHQNIGEAFANSCNGAFAELGLLIDQAKMRELASRLLFNTDLPLSIAYSKSSYAMGENASVWEIMQTAIGQGSTQMTPMHLAMLTAAVANGGTLMKPYFIDHIENSDGVEIERFSPSTYGSLMSAQEAGTLATAMRMVVTQGTGSALLTDAYEAVGKTGSAELEKGGETHAWFSGYAPAENPGLVVTVIVERGGSGGTAAAPVARAVFDAFSAALADLQ